ncbi:MAG: ribonuclease P protein component [Anaerolineae bacterium]|nr:ribonuclease P protein component [Anaerolineae bacterium]
MEKRLRLRGRADFARLRAEGHTLQHRLLMLSYLPNEQGHNRYGLVVSRRIGKAVARNLIRRRLREILQHRDPSIAYPKQTSDQSGNKGCDIVIIARTPIVDASYQEIDEAVGDLLRRARLLL